MATKQGLVFNGSAVGEKVCGRYRQGGHPSGVAFKRGFTVLGTSYVMQF